MGQCPWIQPGSLTWPLPSGYQLVSWPRGKSPGVKEQDTKPGRRKERRPEEDGGCAMGICKDTGVDRCFHQNTHLERAKVLPDISRGEEEEQS